VLLLTALWLLRGIRREDPVRRAWSRFCDKLAREGLARARARAPLDYASRVALALPARENAVRAIAASTSISATAEHRRPLDRPSEAFGSGIRSLKPVTGSSWLRPSRCRSGWAARRRFSGLPAPQGGEAVHAEMVRSMASQGAQPRLRQGAVSAAIIKAMEQPPKPRSHPGRLTGRYSSPPTLSKRACSSGTATPSPLARRERIRRYPRKSSWASSAWRPLTAAIIGTYRVIDALATLAFDYPKRAQFFRGELANYLMLRPRGTDRSPARQGMYAGRSAFPSSCRVVPAFRGGLRR